MKKMCFAFVFIFIFVPGRVWSSDEIESINSNRAISMVPGLNIREKPDVKSSVVGKLNTGDIVKLNLLKEGGRETINDIEDFWYNVEFSGIKGYVFGYYLAAYSEGQHIIVSKKMGRILFLGEKNEVLNIVNYTSFEQKLKEAEKKYGKENVGGKKVENDQVKMDTDDYLLLQSGSGWFYSEGYLYAQKIYNNRGRVIFSEDGCSIIRYSMKNKSFIIINTSCSYDSDSLTGKYQLIDIEGKILKKGLLPLKSKYKEMVSDSTLSHEFLINEFTGVFLWSNNSDLRFIDMKDGSEKSVNIDFPFELPEGDFALEVKKLKFKTPEKLTFEVDIWKYYEDGNWAIEKHDVEYNLKTGKFRETK